MLKEILNTILALLAEQEKEHGYFVLAKNERGKEEDEISPCPFAVERSTATLFWLSPF